MGASSVNVLNSVNVCDSITTTADILKVTLTSVGKNCFFFRQVLFFCSLMCNFPLLCGVVFSSTDTLSRHIKETHAVDDLICPICDKSFDSFEEKSMHIIAERNLHNFKDISGCGHIYNNDNTY